MCVHRQVDADFLWPFVRDHGGLTAGKRFEGLYGLADEAHVEIEAHAGDVAGLLGAQHVAGTAHLKVLHSHGHARAQIVVLGDGGQTVIGSLRQRGALRVEEVGVAALAGAAHAPAQLVQLG